MIKKILDELFEMGPTFAVWPGPITNIAWAWIVILIQNSFNVRHKLRIRYLFKISLKRTRMWQTV